MHRILPRFTATSLQAATYLGGIALFSIAFLVFLNSSISFVITDVIGQREGVGNAVGTLGFADELVALVACPLWGLVSDKIGVRWVAVAGYMVIGLSLVSLVQSARVYPDLIIWRMVFSIGGAACTTMVTAVLPTMTAVRNGEGEAMKTGSGVGIPARTQSDGNVNRHSLAASVSSELTITPARFQSRSKSSPLLAHYRRRRRSVPNLDDSKDTSDPHQDASRLAGFVGMFTGIGALIALVAFLPLPTVLGNNLSKAQAVQSAFYIVGFVSLVVALLVSIGLRHLPGEESKGLRQLFHRTSSTSPSPSTSYLSLLASSLHLAISDPNITLGYAGGFVARASSVGISLFIPLFVNAYFIRSGLCTDSPSDTIRASCEKAYKLASMLTGVSQLVALLAAPLYGFFNARYARRRVASRVPLALAAVAGAAGNALFATLRSPDPKSAEGRWALLAVVLVGLGQIGAIVCSLGLLAVGIQTSTLTRAEGVGAAAAGGAPVEGAVVPDGGGETAPLLGNGATDASRGGEEARQGVEEVKDRSHLKGSIAGVYSLAGGAGILLLTKLGGHMFDAVSVGAPFWLLAGFNGVLLLVVGAVVVVEAVDRGTERTARDGEGGDYGCGGVDGEGDGVDGRGSGAG